MPAADETELYQKKKYLCEDCGYTFERNATFVVKDCPICAGVQVTEVVSKEEDFVFQ